MGAPSWPGTHNESLRTGIVIHRVFITLVVRSQSHHPGEPRLRKSLPVRGCIIAHTLYARRRCSAGALKKSGEGKEEPIALCYLVALWLLLTCCGWAPGLLWNGCRAHIMHVPRLGPAERLGLACANLCRRIMRECPLQTPLINDDLQAAGVMGLLAASPVARGLSVCLSEHSPPGPARQGFKSWAHTPVRIWVQNLGISTK